MPTESKQKSSLKTFVNRNVFIITLLVTVVFFLVRQNTHSVRSSRPEVFLRKGVLEIWSKFRGQHPCRIGSSVKLLCNFIETTLRHGCSPVNLLHIFRKPFSKNTSEGLLLFCGF